MSDLRTLLHEAVAPAGPIIATSVADADVARARRALRRRRGRRLNAGSGLVAVAAIGTFVVVSLSSPPTEHDSAAPGRSSSVALASYTGKQPVGYVLEKVPVGWAVRADTASLLTIAPKVSAQVNDLPGATSLVGTIAIMTESDTGVPTGVQLDKVTVGGRSAVIAHMLGSGDTRTLFAKQPSGVYLEIQVWDGLGWDNNKIAAFAESVHITKDAQQSVG